MLSDPGGFHRVGQPPSELKAKERQRRLLFQESYRCNWPQNRSPTVVKDMSGVLGVAEDLPGELPGPPPGLRRDEEKTVPPGASHHPSRLRGPLLSEFCTTSQGLAPHSNFIPRVSPGAARGHGTGLHCVQNPVHWNKPIWIGRSKADL